MEIILTNILKVTLIVISFAITYAICKYVKSKTEEITKYVGYDYLDILWKIENIVENCVIETNETFVKQLKAEGAFTKEKQLEALDKTFNTALSELSDSMMEVLEAESINVANLLTTLIEKAVKNQKRYNENNDMMSC